MMIYLANVVINARASKDFHKEHIHIEEKETSFFNAV